MLNTGQNERQSAVVNGGIKYFWSTAVVLMHTWLRFLEHHVIGDNRRI